MVALRSGKENPQPRRVMQRREASQSLQRMEE